MGRTTFTNNDAEVLKRRLADLQQQPAPSETKKPTQREWVRENEEAINALLERGFNIRQIADGLSGEGVDIIASTLRSCLQNFKRERGELPPPKKHRRRRRTKRNLPVESLREQSKSTTERMNTSEATTRAVNSANSSAGMQRFDVGPEEQQPTANSLESATFQARKFKGPI